MLSSFQPTKRNTNAFFIISSNTILQHSSFQMLSSFQPIKRKKATNTQSRVTSANGRAGA
jgi:hypothetical protein